MSKRIRWGILGCGDVAEVKSGPGFQLADGSELVAVMRRNSALAEDFAKRHNVPKWYDNADALIHDADVDAVYVATPPGSHLDYGLRVCEAGKPAYIEKPMARTHAECQQLIDAFSKKKLPLFVAFYRRCLPRFLKVKELIDTGSLGTITGISYRYEEPPRDVDPDNLPWRLKKEDAGGGLFFDLGCHVLDLMDHLLGPLQFASGLCERHGTAYDVEDSVAGTFRAAGAVGTISFNFIGMEQIDRMEIVGTAGKVTFSAFRDAPVVLLNSEGEASFDIPHPPHVQQPLIQTIVNELLHKGTCPSTGVSAARTAAIMDQIVMDFYRTRAVGP